MSTELVDLSIAYLSGWKTIRDYAEWIAGIDWDSPGLNQESLEFAGRVELLITEIAEGLRSEDDLLQIASDFVSSKTDTIYTIQASATNAMPACSSSDPTSTPLLVFVQ